MSKLGLIIQREYSTRVKKKAFIVLTILIPILIVGFMFFMMWMGMKETKHMKVLVADPRNICNEKIFVGQDENPPATFYFYQDMLLVDDFINDSQYQEYDVFVALDPDVITNKTVNAAYREEPASGTKVYIQSRLSSRLEEYYAIDQGISLNTYREIRQPIKFSFSDVKDEGATTLEIQRQAVGFVFSILIFIFIIVYAAQVMRSVIEEKTSRVVEIIVSSVKPFQLMMGKIIAVGLVGLTQFAIWIILIFTMMFVLRSFVFPDMMDPGNVAMMQEGVMPGMETAMNNDVVNLVFNQINWGLLIFLFLIYFLGGYLLYGGLFAMIGSAVDSETDTQPLMFPVMMPLIFTYVTSIIIMMEGNINGNITLWLSQIPFTSPVIMLQRVAAGTVTGLEVVISIVILVLTFIFTTYLAGKIYRVGILMYGKKVTWKELFKWMKH